LQLFLKDQHLCLLACGDMSGRPSQDHLMAWEGDKYMAPERSENRFKPSEI